MEHENMYASKGVAGAGLGLGIAGTALGLLAGGLNGTGILGMGRFSDPASVPVSRYEQEQAAKIAALETEVKLRDANAFTMGEMNNFRNYVDARLERIENQLCDQKVYNATLNGTVSCIQGQIAQLASLTKLVIPNGSICPGWGNVTVAPEAATAGG